MKSQLCLLSSLQSAIKERVYLKHSSLNKKTPGGVGDMIMRMCFIPLNWTLRNNKVNLVTVRVALRGSEA